MYGLWSIAAILSNGPRFIGADQRSNTVSRVAVYMSVAPKPGLVE
jgi:hypothetical protein